MKRKFCEVLLHLLGGAPGQNPVERDYNMADEARVNQLDGEVIDKVEIIRRSLRGRPQTARDAGFSQQGRLWIRYLAHQSRSSRPRRRRNLRFETPIRVLASHHRSRRYSLRTELLYLDAQD